MGARIIIRLVSDPYDEQERAPFLGRDFRFEITGGSIWKDQPPFLSPAEAALLEAPYFDGGEYEETTPVDPAALAAVLRKVKAYLQEHADELPYELHIDLGRMQAAGLDYELTVQGSRCWVDGDSYYQNSILSLYQLLAPELAHTQQPAVPAPRVRIVSHPHEPTEVEFWLTVDEREAVEIDGRRYFFGRITRAEHFADELDWAIDFCEYAIGQGQQVYWLYEH